MSSGISRLIKALAIVIWVLGFIIGFGTGSLGGVPSYSYSNQSTFNMWTALITWLMFFIIGTLYFSFGVLVGHVIDHQEDSGNKLEQISAALERVLAVAKTGAPLAKTDTAERAVPYDPYVELARSTTTVQQSAPAPIAKAPEGTVYRKKNMRYVSPSTVICPFCLHEQFSNRSSCLWCGAKFID